MNARGLLNDLRARNVILEAQGKFLKVNAPVGVLTQECKAALREHKPKLLELLSLPRDDLQEGPERESVAHWAGPGIVKIRDPFTGEWHRWPAAECLPGVVAEADGRRKGGAA